MKASLCSKSFYSSSWVKVGMNHKKHTWKCLLQRVLMKGPGNYIFTLDVSLARLCSKLHWRRPSALNLLILVAKEQKLPTKNYWALLEYGAAKA